MIDWKFAAACVAGLLLVWTAFLSLVFRQKKGRFKIVQDDRHQFRFVSDFGRIAIHSDTRMVAISSWGKSETIPFLQIQRLDYAVTSEDIRSTDEDGSGRVRGVDYWFHLSIVLSGGRKVPLYTVGQYEAQGPLPEWWYALQRGTLCRLGLFKGADETALGVVRKVQEAFAVRGCVLRLV